MRISDWSSDVCSSDLCRTAHHSTPAPTQRRHPGIKPPSSRPNRDPARLAQPGNYGRGIEPPDGASLAGQCPPASERPFPRCCIVRGRRPHPCRFPANRGADRRSEEHTSELQSLMRISYAVFCLKKKKETTTTQ